MNCDTDDDGTFDLQLATCDFAPFNGPPGTFTNLPQVTLTEPGSHDVSLRVSDGVDAPVFSTVTVQVDAPPIEGGIPDQFDIEVRIAEGVLTPSQRAVLDDAVERWEAVLGAGVPSHQLDWDPAIYEGTFCEPHAYEGEIDDLLIVVGLAEFDGFAAQAGYCNARYYDNGEGYIDRTRYGNLIPTYGVVEIDPDAAALSETQGWLEGLLVHEIGHVLGIGGHPTWVNSISPPRTDPFDPDAEPVDNRLAVFGTLHEWSLLGDDDPLPPVENTGQQGTRYSHWRESVFQTEVMTGWLTRTGGNELSRLTVSTLAALGYSVDPAAADDYVLPSGAASRRGGLPTVELGDDVLVLPEESHRH